jgi:hypothetical protein
VNCVVGSLIGPVTDKGLATITISWGAPHNRQNLLCSIIPTPHALQALIESVVV